MSAAAKCGSAAAGADGWDKDSRRPANLSLPSEKMARGRDSPSGADGGKLAAVPPPPSDSESEANFDERASHSSFSFRHKVVAQIVSFSQSKEARRSAFDGLRKWPSRSWASFRGRGYIFSHESCIINLWDALLALCILYIAIWAPVVLVFEAEVHASSLTVRHHQYPLCPH